MKQIIHWNLCSHHGIAILNMILFGLLPIHIHAAPAYNLTLIGPGKGSVQSYWGTAIGNRGDLASIYLLATPGGTRYFLWDNGKPYSPSGRPEQPTRYHFHGINDNNEVAASIAGAYGADERAGMLVNKQFMEINTPSTYFSDAYDVNNDRWVVGEVYYCCGVPRRAFVWDTKNHIELNPVGHRDSIAKRRDRTPIDLGYGAAYSINKFDDVVGTSNGQATLWKDGIAINLNSYLSPTLGIALISASDINDRGQIIGTFSSGHGPDDREIGAFILSPVPEVETWMFMLTGISLLLYKKGRLRP